MNVAALYLTVRHFRALLSSCLESLSIRCLINLAHLFFCRSRLHSSYATGDVFRVSPNELSFASVASWRAIYGHPIPASKPTFVKSQFYEMYGAGFKKLCIGSERDPAKHGVMRKHLSAAFSTRALAEQESIVARVLDEFIERIGWEDKYGEKEKGINVTKWYEMVSFDVLGEMAFGQSFGCVKTGVSDSLSLSRILRLTGCATHRRKATLLG